MYFDFEGRNFETPTVESAISWREQLLVSLFLHLAAVLLVLLVPRLAFVESLAERRAERLAELGEAKQQALLLQPAPDDRTFVFVAPKVDSESDDPPRPDAFLSDRDRVARSPERVPDAANRLPVADGNTLEFVESDDVSEEPEPGETLDADPDVEEREEPPPDETLDDTPVEDRLADATAGREEDGELTDAIADDPGTRADDLPGVGTAAESSITTPGSGPGDPDPDPDREARADGLLGQVRETLRRSLQEQSFGNVSGDTGRYGPEIQFDTKGVEFGPWIRRFVAQIRRNWFIPYSVLANHGHVVLTFNVHRDGSISELSVLQPSAIDSFNHSASNALRMSNPTQPLPTEYPDDAAAFTVTFYFNEIPPDRRF